MDINLPAPAAPGETIIASALSLVATLTKAATQVDAENNTKPMIDAAIDEHAKVAIDKLHDALKRGVSTDPKEKAVALDIIRRMAQPVVMTFCCFWLAGCGFGSTRIPIDNDPKTAYYDASTPAPYSPWNSGYLDEIALGGHDFMVITTNRAKLEPTIFPYTDKYGNHVFLLEVDAIDAEYKAKKDAIRAKREGSK